MIGERLGERAQRTQPERRQPARSPTHHRVAALDVAQRRHPVVLEVAASEPDRAECVRRCRVVRGHRTERVDRLEGSPRQLVDPAGHVSSVHRQPANPIWQRAIVLRVPAPAVRIGRRAIAGRRPQRAAGAGWPRAWPDTDRAERRATCRRRRSGRDRITGEASMASASWRRWSARCRSWFARAIAFITRQWAPRERKRNLRGRRAARCGRRSWSPRPGRGSPAGPWSVRRAAASRVRPRADRGVRDRAR